MRRQPHVSGQVAILLSAPPHLAIAGPMIRSCRGRMHLRCTPGNRSCSPLGCLGSQLPLAQMIDPIRRGGREALLR